MKLFQLLNILTIILGLGLITACEENINTKDARWYPPEKNIEINTKPLAPQSLWGHWVCTDFVDLVKARRTVRDIRSRPMFLEIIFKPEFGDSVLLVTGYTNFFAAYTKSGTDSILIKNVSVGKNLVLYAVDGLRKLELADSFQKADNVAQVHAWTYTKAIGDNNKSLYSKTPAINRLINEGILSGTYSNGQNGNVVLQSNGSVSGWAGISNYEICTGGDCFMLTRSPLDIVKLSGAGKSSYFAFWIKTNDSVYFYNLTKKAPAPPYNYQPEGVAYAFKKEK